MISAKEARAKAEEAESNICETQIVELLEMIEKEIQYRSELGYHDGYLILGHFSPAAHNKAAKILEEHGYVVEIGNTLYDGYDGRKSLTIYW